MILILHPVEILQVRAHLLGGLGDLRHLDVDELLEVKERAPHLGVEQCVAAATLMLGQDPHAVDRHSVGAAEFEQDVEQSEREQPSTGALKLEETL